MGVTVFRRKSVIFIALARSLRRGPTKSAPRRPSGFPKTRHRLLYSTVERKMAHLIVASPLGSGWTTTSSERTIRTLSSETRSRPAIAWESPKSAGFLSSGQGCRDSLDGLGATTRSSATLGRSPIRGVVATTSSTAAPATTRCTAMPSRSMRLIPLSSPEGMIVSRAAKQRYTLWRCYNCLRGRGGDDWLDGGAGDDTLSGDAFPWAIFSLAGTIDSRAERAMTSSTAMASTRASWNRDRRQRPPLWRFGQ